MARDPHLAAHNAHLHMDRSILIMLVRSGVLTKDYVISFLNDQKQQLSETNQHEEAKLYADFLEVFEAVLEEAGPALRH